MQTSKIPQDVLVLAGGAEVRPIPDHEGYYITDTGYLISTIPIGKDRIGRPKILKGTIKDSGHLRYTLRPGYFVYAHHLVAKIFIGPCPDGLECCHNDGNPLNNLVGNLRWDTHASNGLDMVKHGNSAKGEKHPHCKLNEYQVLEIKQRVRNWRRGMDSALAREYGVHKETIRGIRLEKNWGWL